MSAIASDASRTSQRAGGRAASYDIAPSSTALHVAAWRGWPTIVKELIARGTPVDAVDGKGRTALLLSRERVCRFVLDGPPLT